MLYIPKGKRKQIATKDIISYRLFILDNHSNLITIPGCKEENCEIMNTFTDYIYEPKWKSEKISTHTYHLDNDKLVDHYFYGRNIIGGYYSFEAIENIERFWYHFLPFEFGDEPGYKGLVIVKCIIPKGTEYYKGSINSSSEGDSHFSGYISKKLRIEGIVKELNKEEKERIDNKIKPLQDAWLEKYNNEIIPKLKEKIINKCN